MLQPVRDLSATITLYKYDDERYWIAQDNGTYEVILKAHGTARYDRPNL